MSVKKENCKDCYEATCKRHATVEVKKGKLRCGTCNNVLRGYFISFGGTPYCSSCNPATNPPMGFGSYLPWRAIMLEYLGTTRPPKKEEPKEAIPHIHPYGISDCQFCAPTLTVNWKLTKHDHSEETKDCPATFCEFNMHPAIRKAFFAPKESDPELALSVGQMKELFDNLVMEGFTKGEAARIVGIVARG